MTKANTTDKSAKVASLAFDVLRKLVGHRVVIKTNSDFDAFRATCIKALDTPFAAVRQSAAHCFAVLLLQLSKLQRAKNEIVEQQQPKKSSSKGKAAADEDEDVDAQRARSPNPSMSSRSSKTAQYFSLSFDSGLNVLVSSYCLGATSPRIRSGITQTFAFLLLTAGPEFLDSNFSKIASTLLVELLSHPNIKTSRYKVLAARKQVQFLFSTILLPQLGEFGQLNAVRLLVNGILKANNASKETLISTLVVVETFITSLGPALGSVQEIVKEALFDLVAHPRYSVQIAACTSFRAYLMASPAQICPILSHCLSILNKDLSKTKPGDKIVGFAYLTAIVAGMANSHPQYSSLELTSRVLTTATSLLKSNGNVDAVSLQVQVGWILLSGLMSLGPDFVKVHLSQLLLLWKSALFKPASSGKDQIAGKGTLELNYLLHVRLYTLTCVVAFLIHNARLVTPDLVRRLSVLLQNTNFLLSTITSKRLNDDDPSQQLDFSVALQDYVYMVRRRVLQCYIYLSHRNHVSDAFPAYLLTSALAYIADPDKNTSSKISISIAAGTGSIDSIWEMADNFAYGLTSKVKGFDITEIKIQQQVSREATSETVKDEQESHWMSELPVLAKMDAETTKDPILDAAEYDIDQLLFFNESTTSSQRSLQSCIPAGTSVVDLSIDVFVMVLPFQTAKVQESILDQLRTYLSNANSNRGVAQTQRRPGRREAVSINSIVTIHGALKYITTSSHIKKDCIKSSKVLKIFLEIIHIGIKDEDPVVRNIAAQAMGMVCAVGGSAMVTEQIKYLIDEIVANRNPNARGGCSISLGYILKYVGGMAAGAHMKTILGILVSLTNDPHPLVHFWALEGICITMESSVLGFSPYASSTLSTLNKLYVSEAHGDEMSSTASSNLDFEWPTARVIARCIRALVNVLGPDLQENKRMQEDIKALVLQFEISGNKSLMMEAQRTIQELSIFAPRLIHLESYIDRLAMFLFDPLNDILRAVAMDNFYQLMRTNTADIFSLTKRDLETDLWLAFDTTPQSRVLRRIIETWMDRSSIDDSAKWISRVQHVLVGSRRAFEKIRSGVKDNNAEKNVDLRDEEDMSFTVNDETTETNTELLKWQTRALALELLRRLVRAMLQGKSVSERMSSPIVDKVGELIKTAFTASTASVIPIRLLGLQLLDDLLIGFHDLVDPEFPEVSLLEQYQAQISSALTPAFSADSSPDLALQAIKVSATFIGSGIIKNVERMGRILRLLTQALESCSSGTQFSLGDLKIFSPNAQVMLRVAVLSLWAELQVSSMNEKQKYLIEVVGTHIQVLVPLWISSLKKFARLRFEPEQSSGLSGASSMDQMYHAVSRTNVLPVYQESWLQLVDAIASLIEHDSKLVFDILDEEDRVAVETNSEEGIQYSNEPAAFFFVLFGLCFEGLVRPQQSLGKNASVHGGRLRVLVALQRILHPAVSGTVIYQDVVFGETIDIFDRLILTGTCEEQTVVVTVARNLCIHHPGAVSRDAVKGSQKEEVTETISESVEQLFELFRIVMLGLTTALPFLSDEVNNSMHLALDEKSLTFIKACLENLVEMISVFPKIIQVDLFACILYVFSRILENDASQRSVVPSALACQRKLLDFMVKTRSEAVGYQETIDLEISTALSHAVTLLTSCRPSQSEGDIIRAKNCILSSVIIVTTDKSNLDPGDSYLSDLARVLVDCISIPQLSVMVAECSKTLLVSCVGTAVGKVLAVNILPAFISFATSGSLLESTEDGVTEEKPSETTVNPIPKLVNGLLVAFTLKLSKDQVQAGLALAVPCLLHFAIDESVGIPAQARRYYVKQQLLQLASFASEQFKLVIQSGLSPEQRAIAESVLRGDDSAAGEENENENSATHIQLKSFGN